MAVGRTNYNGSTTANSTAKIADPNASRQRFFFKAVGGDMTLNFGADATADNVLTVPQGSSVSFNCQDVYDIRQQINVFATDVYKFECQTEEMTI